MSSKNWSRGRDLTPQEMRVDSVAEECTRKKRAKKKTIEVECRWLVTYRHRKGWHHYGWYFTVAEAERVVATLNKRDNFRQFGTKKVAWMEYRLAESALESSREPEPTNAQS